MLENRHREPLVEIDSSSEEARPDAKQDPNTTAQSVRRSVNIPNLDLKKINSSDATPAEQLPADTQLNPGAVSSARSTSIFDRDTFAHYKGSSLKPRDDGSIPELVRVREEAIQKKKLHCEAQLSEEFRQNKFSPRTYKVKQRELETWVTKEREDIKQIKKNVAQEWEKTASIISSTQQDAHQVKQILRSARSGTKLGPPDDLTHPMGSSARSGLPSIRIDSQRKSHRQQQEESKLIDLIYDRKHPNGSSSQSGNEHESVPSQSHGQSHSSYHEELEQEP